VLPLWRSASGRVFLAYLSERETAELLHEEEPQLAPAEVAAEVERIRENGFATTGNSDAEEFAGIAAPVLDHDGAVVAALTLSRPYDENTRERRMHLGTVVRDAAADISKQLGHAHETAARSVPMKGSYRGLGKSNAANPV
jgi:DNA-binding IclR family transcriptional regulator